MHDAQADGVEASSALPRFHSESGPYGGFVWARRALNSPKRWSSAPGSRERRRWVGIRPRAARAAGLLLGLCVVLWCGALCHAAVC
jgi:hypothetical protein